MFTEKPFIFYSLPKSRTTQQLIRGRKIDKAWDNVCNFLTNCTTATPDKPTKILLTAYSAFPGDSNPEIAEKIIQETKHLFDSGKSEPVSYAYPSGIPDKQIVTEWIIKDKDLQKAIDYLSKGQPWPKFSLGPVELIITFYFKLIDPITKTELSNQKEESNLMIWLSRNCVCSPSLYFPFEQVDENFKKTNERLEPYFPFKLEEKYFRLGRPNKSKTQYIFKKIKSD